MFSQRCPVDAMWKEWKAWSKRRERSQRAQTATLAGAQFLQLQREFPLWSVRFCFRFPLFRSAYYYYWFYMFLI
jgi:hypothetical protein